MKKLVLSLGLIVAIVGCSTTAQRTAYNTISSIDATATVAVDGYYTLVLQGKVPTNSVPAVSKAYNELKLAEQVAETASQAGTNALAPANLILEASQLGTLIQTIETTK